MKNTKSKICSHQFMFPNKKSFTNHRRWCEGLLKLEPITQSKICSRCKKDKLLNEFRNDKYHRSGKTSACKECLKTYTQEDIRCYYCHTWFTKKKRDSKFCDPKCHKRYWSKIWRLSTKGNLYMMEYHREYKR